MFHRKMENRKLENQTFLFLFMPWVALQLLPVFSQLLNALRTLAPTHKTVQVDRFLHYISHIGHRSISFG